MTEEKGPLLPLSRKWRGAIGFVLLGLAVAHMVWPQLAIDALSVGLFGGAVLVTFFDIESFEWQGIKARRLQEEVEVAERAVESVRVPMTPPALPAPSTGQLSGGTDIQQIVHEDAWDLMPPVDRLERLLWGAEQIRVELIVLAGSGGQLPSRVSWDRYRSADLAETLAAKDVIPQQLVEPVLTVVRARDAAVHSSARQKPELLESASSLAMDVLGKLRDVKRNYIRVRYQDIVLFGDQSLSARLPFPGVMLATLDDAGVVRHVGVYPRLPHYQTGRFVSWEWSANPSVDEAWYRDPFTNKTTLAFSASMSFVGREFPAQWGLEYRLPRPDVGLE